MHLNSRDGYDLTHRNELDCKNSLDYWGSTMTSKNMGLVGFDGHSGLFGFDGDGLSKYTGVGFIVLTV